MANFIEMLGHKYKPVTIINQMHKSESNEIRCQKAAKDFIMSGGFIIFVAPKR